MQCHVTMDVSRPISNRCTWSLQLFLNPFEVYCQSDAIMEWAAEKAGLIPKNDEDKMAMRMIIGKTHIYQESFQWQIWYNLRNSFSETVKEAKVQALGQAMKACEAAGMSFFEGKFDCRDSAFGIQISNQRHWKNLNIQLKIKNSETK